MSKALVRNVVELVDELAPFLTAEDFDNTGLLLGRPDAEIDNILCTLDVTGDVVREAADLGAQLIVSHHPLLFHAAKNLREDTPENKVICELIRHHIALISAHTNLDKTPFSGSACVARALRLQNIRQNGYLFIGELEKALTAKQLGALIGAALHAPLRVYGEPAHEIATLAIAGGAYGEGAPQALEAGAQAYLTGEFRHHEIMDATARGLTLFEGGHYATEAPLVEPLCQYLQNALDALQYKVRVYPSTCVSYIGALE